MINGLMTTEARRLMHGSRERARRLGTLIADTLRQECITRVEFASRLGIDRKWVDAIIGGIFPLSQIDDDLLAQIARQLNLSEDTLRVLRDPPGQLPPLPTAEPGEDAAPAREDVFAMLRTVQAEFSADGQDMRGPSNPNLRSINAMLNEVREGGVAEPPRKPAGSHQLRRITDTLKSFQDDGGEEDA